MQDNDPIRAAQPLEPRRGSTVEMVDRIKAEEARVKRITGVAHAAKGPQEKEPPRGR